MENSDRVICPRCGEPHDLSEMEPSYCRPDAFLEVPEEERVQRTLDGKDACAVRSADDSVRQYFLRVLLPMPIRGERKPISWGVWVEVTRAAYARASELWDDPEQHREPPFPATLANRLNGYTGTLGLPGFVQLTDPTSVPRFLLDTGSTHPLALEQREGVWPERAMEWHAAHHG